MNRYIWRWRVCGHSEQRAEHHGTKLLLRVISTTFFLPYHACSSTSEPVPLSDGSRSSWRRRIMAANWACSTASCKRSKVTDLSEGAESVVASLIEGLYTRITRCCAQCQLLLTSPHDLLQLRPRALLKREREMWWGSEMITRVLMHSLQYSYTVQACFLTNTDELKVMRLYVKMSDICVHVCHLWWDVNYRHYSSRWKPNQNDKCDIYKTEVFLRKSRTSVKSFRVNKLPIFWANLISAVWINGAICWLFNKTTGILQHGALDVLKAKRHCEDKVVTLNNIDK